MGRAMRLEQTDYCIILLLSGMVLSVVGMLDYTGIMDTPLPGQAVFAGYVLVFFGIILFYKDRKDNEAAIDDYDYDCFLEENLSSVLDDGYVIDLAADDCRYMPADLPPIDDLTVGGKTEPSREKVFCGTEVDIAGAPLDTSPAGVDRDTPCKEGRILRLDLDIAGEEVAEENEYLSAGEMDIAGCPVDRPDGDNTSDGDGREKNPTLPETDGIKRK